MEHVLQAWPGRLLEGFRLWFTLCALQRTLPRALAGMVPTGAFIEDAANSAAAPTFHMLLGAARSHADRDTRLLSSDLPKASWIDAVALDFNQPAAALRKSAPALEQSVKIYVHQVPLCAGVEVLREFIPSADGQNGSTAAPRGGFGWPLAIQLHAEHALVAHEAILASEAIVRDPAAATVFYIPAFLGMLVERWLDTRDPDHLNCISATWNALPEDIFLRNAGYDHFLIAGTCHPYSICSSMECDITLYHPFAGNVAVLVGGVRDLGHPDVAFTPASMFRNLRVVLLPFPVRLDCVELARLAERPRPVVVAFVGSENSRVRRLFREALTDPRWPHGRDPRVQVRVLPDSADGEAARRAALGGGPVSQLFADSEFCLVLPGHVYDLGRRAYDAMARGCLPVVVAAAPMHVSVPFAWQLPWHDFAIFDAVGSVEEAASLIGSLLQATEGAEGRARTAARRAALLRHAPSIFLPPHAHCPPGGPSAVHGLLRELGVRQATWAAFRALRPEQWARVPGR
mmetsp:Transcript_57666/g.163733  ORF Transcript_57666/g.163733 Transcript_57666/m.163733 type:complete len:516 (-) Transcript_57666:5-1552(-)